MDPFLLLGIITLMLWAIFVIFVKRKPFHKATMMIGSYCLIYFGAYYTFTKFNY